MKISLNWLEDFVEITEKNNDKIKEIITARSAEIETMESLADNFGNVVVGEILEFDKHPDANKLHVAKVDVGKAEPIQLIFGQMVEMKVGDKVPVAVAPTKLMSGNVIEKTKIRRVTTEGMLCLDQELGLKDEGVSIQYFPNEKPGTSVSKLLGLDDTVIDIDNHAITNRSDLFSHRGFAREFVACGLAKWKKFKWANYDQSKLPTNSSPAPIEVEIKDDGICHNYYGVYITGIEVKQSPEWMQKRLLAIGIRPISNLVDITNYVMYELGMPTHAFDVDQVKGKKWTMRKSKEGEKVITLDEKELELFDDVSVLDDGNELFDLCGVMGGLHSGINSKTNRIWLHSPVDDAVRTRIAMRGLNQISDAGIIYEKGVDSELAKDGLNRCIELILELCPNAKIASKVTHIQNYKSENRTVKLRNSHIERLIGDKIPSKEVEKILTDLGFELKKESTGYTVTVPSWRLNDVSMEADLIEEIARVYSYDKIPFKTPEMDISPIPISKHRIYERELKEKLVSFGFNEIYTFAFLGPELLTKTGLEPDNASIEIDNPISSDMSLMRQSLLPRTLEAIANNLRYKKQFRLFEIGRTYNKSGESSEEKSQLILASVGEDFRDLQGAVESLGFDVKPEGATQGYQHPGRLADLVMRDQKIGTLYELHPQIAKNFGIKSKVVVAEINIEAIHAMNIDHKTKYTEIPKYPSSKLDVSILIPKKKLAENYFNAIQKTDKTLVKNIELIDEYAGSNIAPDKRSLTYSITYRSDEGTLTEEQVSEVHKKVLSSLQGVGAVIRD